MFSDIKGREIPIGSTVHVRYVITNEIAAGDPVNLLAKLEHPWPGVPDDQRFALASQFIELVDTGAPHSKPGFDGILPPHAAPAATEPAPAATGEKDPKHARR